MITLADIIALALRDAPTMDALGEALRSDLVVAHPFYRQMCTFADDFLMKHRKLPGDGDWQIFLDGLPDAQADGCRNAFGTLEALDTSTLTPGWVIESVRPVLHAAAAKTALARMNSLQELEPATLLELAERVEAVGIRNVTGLAHLSDIDAWSVPPREDDLIPTGFPRLDAKIGGWGQELWMIFADSGVGKTFLLQNLTANAAHRGRKCLHITLELGLRSQIHRYYRQLAQAKTSEFRTNLPGVKGRLRHWFKFSKGEIHLMELDAYSISPSELKGLVSRVSRTVGGVDFLTLDYIDLLSPDTHRGRPNNYEDLGRITHTVRSISKEIEGPVLTASQAVRIPKNKKHLTKQDMGDSYNKVRGADGLLAFMQTEDEAEVHQGRIGVVKSRESSGWNVEFPVYVNLDFAIIQDLDHPNTRELMRRLGHLPK